MLRFNAIIHNVNKTLTFNKANKSIRFLYLYQQNNRNEKFKIKFRRIKNAKNIFKHENGLFRNRPT